ncbi:MAG: cyclic pyranopterin monophosphate synthase MoaC [Planctomycetota bacterium]|nr:cyclic pyranopterin monophosphate synthase MoaC [Planctomycetota bacterium]
MSDESLTHLDAEGRARMVDVSPKPETARRAVAEAIVRMRAATRDQVLAGDLPKGDALATARLAAVNGAKQTSALIPLCHPLRLTRVDAEAEAVGTDAVRFVVEARAVDRTGVEMEALTGAAVAALTLYDMIKGVDRTAVVERIQLLEKVGGKTGHWTRDASQETNG